MGNRRQFKNEEDWLIYKSNERIRLKLRMKKEYDMEKNLGLCHKCGCKCNINLKTNKYYWRCNSCRGINE